MENKYGAKHRCWPVIQRERVPGNKLFACATASGCGQLSFNPYDLCSDDEEYLMPKVVAETTP